MLTTMSGQGRDVRCRAADRAGGAGPGRGRESNGCLACSRTATSRACAATSGPAMRGCGPTRSAALFNLNPISRHLSARPPDHHKNPSSPARGAHRGRPNRALHEPDFFRTLLAGNARTVEPTKRHSTVAELLAPVCHGERARAGRPDDRAGFECKRGRRFGHSVASGRIRSRAAASTSAARAISIRWSVAPRRAASTGWPRPASNPWLGGPATARRWSRCTPIQSTVPSRGHSGRSRAVDARHPHLQRLRQPARWIAEGDD